MLEPGASRGRPARINISVLTFANAANGASVIDSVTALFTNRIVGRASGGPMRSRVELPAGPGHRGVDPVRITTTAGRG